MDDAAVVQLYAEGFASLPLRERTLIWHLSQATLAGFTEERVDALGLPWVRR